MSCMLKNTNECKNASCNKTIEKVCGSFQNSSLKIETEGTQIFNVPHNAEGTTFLALCKKYINSPRYRLVKRGRNSKRPKFSECGYDSARSLKAEHSAWFAVYPRRKPTKEENERGELEYKAYLEKWNKRNEALEAVKRLEEFVKI